MWQKPLIINSTQFTERTDNKLIKHYNKYVAQDAQCCFLSFGDTGAVQMHTQESLTGNKKALAAI